MKSISVVIVNWNAGHQLLECVNSVIQYGETLVGQIIIVDNGSTDGSDNDCVNLPQVTLIRAGLNLGFAKACNIAAAQARSEFLLFLNPDTRLFSDSLVKVLDFMQKQENIKVGICGLQLIDEHGHNWRSCARYPSPIRFFVHAIGLDRFLPTLGHFMSEWDHTTTREVDHVIGAFYFVRRHVFEMLHGFDERFFVYLEDIDFSCRARRLGWISLYLAEAQAFHAGGGTSRHVKALRLFYSLRSRILYAFKHFNPFAAMLVLLATLCLEFLSRSLQATSHCSREALKEIWTAYSMLFRWLPVWILKGVTS